MVDAAARGKSTNSSVEVLRVGVASSGLTVFVRGKEGFVVFLDLTSHMINRLCARQSPLPSHSV